MIGTQHFLFLSNVGYVNSDISPLVPPLVPIFWWYSPTWIATQHSITILQPSSRYNVCKGATIANLLARAPVDPVARTPTEVWDLNIFYLTWDRIPAGVTEFVPARESNTVEAC